MFRINDAGYGWSAALPRRGMRLSISARDKETKLLDARRVLRNDFAHGDWPNVKLAVGKLPFVDALSLISSIFTKIENGMPKRD